MPLVSMRRSMTTILFDAGSLFGILQVVEIFYCIAFQPVYITFVIFIHPRTSFTHIKNLHKPMSARKIRTHCYFSKHVPDPYMSKPCLQLSCNLFPHRIQSV